MRFGGTVALAAALAKRRNPKDSSIGRAIKAVLLRRNPRRDGIKAEGEAAEDADCRPESFCEREVVMTWFDGFMTIASSLSLLYWGDSPADDVVVRGVAVSYWVSGDSHALNTSSASVIDC